MFNIVCDVELGLTKHICLQYSSTSCMHEKRSSNGGILTYGEQIQEGNYHAAWQDIYPTLDSGGEGCNQQVNINGFLPVLE